MGDFTGEGTLRKNLGNGLPTQQGWISDMGIDGPTFVPKSGYFLLIWVKVCPQKLAFFFKFFSEFYELAFLTKCWLFQTRNPPLSLFLAFLAVVFSQFCSHII